MASPNAMHIILILMILGVTNLPYQGFSQLIPGGDDLLKLFEQWIVQFNRVYRDEAERAMRFNIFKNNAELILGFDRGQNKKFNLTLNQFADLTEEEFQKYFTGYNKNLKATTSAMSTTTNNGTDFMYGNAASVPYSIDWRAKGAVTPVKDQGECGSCYAFAAIAAVESLIYIRQGKLLSLSEQEIIDCDQNNRGCNYGYMQYVYNFIQKYGITTNSYYPYASKKGWCQNSATKIAATKITGYQSVPQDSEADLLKAVANQPVAVAVDSSSYQFRFYSGGVLNAECGTQCDHAVLIVGYGANDNGDKYWIVKNSWGTEWGEGGYGYFSRDVADPRGICGIATDASYPTV